MIQSQKANVNSTISGILHIIDQKIQSRKIRLAYNTLFSFPENKLQADQQDFIQQLEELVNEKEAKQKHGKFAIIECLESIRKLEYMKYAITPENARECKLLLYQNVFERQHLARIKDLLSQQSIQATIWPADIKPKPGRKPDPKIPRGRRSTKK